MKKSWVRAAIAVVMLLLAAVVIVPFLVNADSFRPTIESELSATLGRKVTLGRLGFSVFTGNLAAQNIVIADDPAFSSNPMLTAKSLSIGVELGKLLFHHTVSITRLTLDTPAIQLIRAPDGKWNFSSLGEGSTSGKSTQAGAIPVLTIGELQIEHGSATVSYLRESHKPFVYNEIKANLKQFSFTRSFPFELSANLPGSGSFALTGTAGPLDPSNTADTSFKATLKVTHFDPVAAGAVEPQSGISMLLNIDAQLASDGKELTSSGTIQAAHLHLARTGAPANKPVDVTYAISSTLATRAGQVQDIAIRAGSAAAHINGSYSVSGQTTMLNLHLSAPNLPVDQIVELLPAVGVTLPSGSALHGGTLSTNLAITGPATAPLIAGPVEIDNTTLAGFDIGSKIQGMNPFGGSGAGTAIQLLKADVNSSPATTQFSNIQAILPQVGTATGNGSVSSDGALAFSLLAKFTATTGGGALLSQGLAAATSFLNSQLGVKAANAIPLTIAGTASNPSIRVNLGKMINPQAGSSRNSGQKSPAGLLNSLFGKQ